MTRYLLPDRNEAEVIIGRPADEGYVWVRHPRLGAIQMPDVPTNITPPEPPNRSIWLDTDNCQVWQRNDDWARDHAPHERWFGTGEKGAQFWPDLCGRAANWVQLDIKPEPKP